jgi:hypothetical protein
MRTIKRRIILLLRRLLQPHHLYTLSYASGGPQALPKLLSVLTFAAGALFRGRDNYCTVSMDSLNKFPAANAC